MRYFYSCLLLLLALTAKGQVVDGGVYQLRNVQYGTMLTRTDQGGLTVSAASLEQVGQFWTARQQTDGTWTLQAYETGQYLTSGMAKSGPWKLQDATSPAASLVISTQGSGYKLKPATHNINEAYLHWSANEQRVISWNTNPQATQWTFQQADEAQLTHLEELRGAKVAQQQFTSLFQSPLCTELTAAYQAMTDEELAQDAVYSCLPAGLQALVRKVRSGDWQETCSDDATVVWNDHYARRFRVQNVEPYSIAERCSGMLNTMAYSNMNNPTGLRANAMQTLYIWVKGTIADGAELRVQSQVGWGMLTNYNAGTVLHEGLNIVPNTNNEAAQFICYSVNTYQNGAKTGHKLSQYAPLQIHIEGGEINGYFDLMGDAVKSPDTEEDWQYMRTRARHTMFSLLGHYEHIYWPIDRQTNDNGGTFGGLKSIFENRQVIPTLKNWDRLQLSARLTIGCLPDNVVNSEQALGLYEPLTNDDVAQCNYGDEFNNHSLAYAAKINYQWAGVYYTGYNISTWQKLLVNFPTTFDDLWGPSHENGHVNQGCIRIQGTKEVSNNLFSNVSCYFAGWKSDGGSVQGTANNFNNGGDYIATGWGRMTMYFQLWYYYHATGKNKKFYPRLFELLRRDPMRPGNPVDEEKDMLHFYKKCCEAAQEDLTDYFNAWGFFRPKSNFQIPDEPTKGNLTQEAIDRVKAQVAAMNLPKNTVVKFIDDKAAERGYLGTKEAFQTGTAPSQDYVFSLTGNTVTMEGGEGGVGFAVYDDQGELLAFSGQKVFPVNAATAQLIASGHATVKAVGSDSQTVEAPNVSLSGLVISTETGTVADDHTLWTATPQGGEEPVPALTLAAAEGGQLAATTSPAESVNLTLTPSASADGTTYTLTAPQGWFIEGYAFQFDASADGTATTTVTTPDGTFQNDRSGRAHASFLPATTASFTLQGAPLEAKNFTVSLYHQITVTFAYRLSADTEPFASETVVRQHGDVVRFPAGLTALVTGDLLENGALHVRHEMDGVPVDVVWGLPFRFTIPAEGQETVDFQQQDWCTLALRDQNKWLRPNAQLQPKALTTDRDLTADNLIAGTRDGLMWAFTGSPLQGTFAVLNYAHPGKSLRATGTGNQTPPVLTDGFFRQWRILKHNNGGFALRTTSSDNACLNLWGNGENVFFYSCNTPAGEAGNNFIATRWDSRVGTTLQSKVTQALALPEGFFFSLKPEAKALLRQLPSSAPAVQLMSTLRRMQADAVVCPDGYYRIKCTARAAAGHYWHAEYYTSPGNWRGTSGYKVLTQTKEAAMQDMGSIFRVTITQPFSAGAQISTQGKYISTFTGDNHPCPLTDNPTTVYLEESGGLVAVKVGHSGSAEHAYAHEEGVGGVVGWTKGVDPSHWTFEPVEEATVPMNTLESKSYATLCVPFAYTLSEDSYQAPHTGFLRADGLVDCEPLLQNADDIVPAGTPLLLSVEAAQGQTPPTSLTIRPVVSSLAQPEGNELSGTYLPATIESTTYVFGAKDGVAGFYLKAPDNASAATPTYSVGKNRAYLNLPAASDGETQLRGFQLAFAGQDQHAEPTGLPATALDPSARTPQQVYDLQGRRVQPQQARRGVYIVDGKKVLM